MKRFDRIGVIFAGVTLAFLLVLFAVIWSIRSPTMQVKAAPLFAPKPVDGWYVCRDLGIGSVPGVPDPRQRFRLCHDSGWVVNTFCIQPGFPVPPVGRSCTRISEDTYRCGARNQRLREYRILQTPVETPIFTDTPTPTASPTLTPPASLVTPTWRPRVPSGGEGNSTPLQLLIVVEIGLLILSAFGGIWIIRRMIKRG